MSSIQVPSIFCLAPEWKETAHRSPTQNQCAYMFPWALWTYCSFMHPCIAISLKTKEDTWVSEEPLYKMDVMASLAKPGRGLGLGLLQCFSSHFLPMCLTSFPLLPLPKLRVYFSFVCALKTQSENKDLALLAQILCLSYLLSDPMT